MAELAVDLTYGNALYEAAVDTGKKDIVLEDAEALLEILKGEPDFYKFMNSPAISAGEKKSFVRETFEGKICEELLNFFYVIIDKRRTMHFERIIKVYRDLIEHDEGVAYGIIKTVQPLSEERLLDIEAQVSKLLDENIKLTNETDPALMAGFKIFVEGKIIDATYKKRFEELASQLSIS